MNLRRESLLRTGILLTGMIILASSYSFATIKYRNLQINPLIGLMISHDSNIYRDSTTVKSSLVKNIFPEVRFFLPVKKHEIKLNYLGEIWEYTENPSQNNATHTNLDLNAKFNFPAGLSASISDAYKYTTDPLTSELVQRAKRSQNTISLGAGYNSGNYVAFNLKHYQTIHDYDRDSYKPLFNRSEQETVFEVAYYISPKTMILIDYGMGTIDYDDAANLNSSKSSQIRTGVKGNLTSKTVGELKFGTKDRTYNDLTGNDESTSVLTLSTLTNFTDRTSLNLSANRNFVESTFYNNIFYISTEFDAVLNQKIYHDFSTNFSCNYIIDDYPQETTIGSVTDTRKDNIFTANIDVTYKVMKWVSISYIYTYKQRDSTFKEFDYYYNLLSLYAKVIF